MGAKLRKMAQEESSFDFRKRSKKTFGTRGLGHLAAPNSRPNIQKSFASSSEKKILKSAKDHGNLMHLLTPPVVPSLVELLGQTPTQNASSGVAIQGVLPYEPPNPLTTIFLLVQLT